MWQPGQKFVPKPGGTVTLTNCGVDAQRGRGWITFIGDGKVSFYLERGTPGAPWIEGVCTLELFGMNFTQDPYDLVANAGYIRSKHYTKQFPNEFFVR
jgi:hypothetical protein